MNVLGQALLAIAGVACVLTYYALAWRRLGTHSHAPLVVRYEPPRGLSPAMLRYVWKEQVDDRTYWACIMSLVAKGALRLASNGRSATVEKNATPGTHPELARDEAAVLDAISGPRKRASLSMDSPQAMYAVSVLASELRRGAVGKWFGENRKVVTMGSVLSAATLLLTAAPYTIDRLAALGISLALMAPGTFYLFFVLLRLADVCRSLRSRFYASALKHLGMLGFLLFCCLSALVVGGGVICFGCGPMLLVLALSLAIVNAAAMLWLHLPTKAGDGLLHEVEGFRHFLQSVEKLPMDWEDAPRRAPGLYEQYLPYAIALEVEQAWSDRFLAANTNFSEEQVGQVRPFYLGLWDGKPIEVMYSITGGRPW